MAQDRANATSAAFVAAYCPQLSALGVPTDDLGAMADVAHAIRRLLDNNPRELGRDAILKMYQAAF